MGCVKLLTLMVACVAVFVGWTAYSVTVPADLQHGDIARVAATTGRLALTLSKLTQRLGLSRLHLSRLLIGLNSRVRSRTDVQKGQYQDLVFNGVRVRYYDPAKRPSDSPVIVYIPGGGWILQAPDIYHKSMLNISTITNYPVVLVEYRTAPEHKYPAALDDCKNVLNYLRGNSKKLRINPARIALMGDSAGGNLAASVSQSMKDVYFIVVINAPLQNLDLNLPSYQKHDHLVTTKEGASYIVLSYLLGHEPSEDMQKQAMENRLYSSSLWKQHGHKISTDLLPKRIQEETTFTQVEIPDDQRGYSQELDDLVTDWQVSPLLADDLSGVPDTLIVSCEYDVYRDDSFLYARRLKDAGVAVTHRNEACFHGALVIVRDHPLWTDLAAIIKDKLATPEAREKPAP